MSKKLYHGSNVIVEHPDIRIRGYEKDFGYGFYCTLLENQAKKWALSRKDAHIVNIYEYEEHGGCNIKVFKTMTEEWLDFIINCRRGIRHDYDIVEGPMADDQVWNYIEDVVAGNVTRTAFWELAKFKHPTHQIVFCTQKAMDCLKFLSHYSI